MPRLLILSSLGLPPVEYCRGTTPSHAANSRPLPKAAPLPMAATMAVATTGPIPGILRMRLQPASAVEISSSFVRQLLDLPLDLLPLTPQHIDQVAHQRRQVGFRVLEDICHGCLELRRCLRENEPSLQ